MTSLTRWALPAAAIVAASSFAHPAPAAAEPPPMPGIEINDDNGRCTAGFAARDNDGDYYLMTSGHCDEHDGSLWTYGDDVSLGYIAASEKEGDQKDGAIVRLDPDVGPPIGDIGGYPVRDVLDVSQIAVGMPFCKLGAVTGETCGAVTDVDGNVVETTVYSLHGDSGSAGFVKNGDGTVSAVGILMSSPDGDDYTTYFTLVGPMLAQWGLTLVP